MLNRTQLRVKAMQTLYAYSLSEDKHNIMDFEKSLSKSVEEAKMKMYPSST